MASVIMPCFNHARYLVDSVNGILRQTYRELELIIVDDCSADDSWEVIRNLATGDPRIKSFRHERNQGASKSRNDGLRHASGEFIGFCDADDVWEEGKLKQQMELLQENQDYDIVYCDTLIIDEDGLSSGRRFSDLFPPPRNPSGWLFLELVARNFINMQAVLMRRKCVQRAGYFDEGIKWVEDWSYWVRLSRDHRFLFAPDTLARYRVHSCSTNRVQQRGYSVNRFKARKRILRSYSDLPVAAKADVFFKMGVDLCELGKLRLGRQLLWNAIGMSMRDVRALGSSCRAMRRLLLHTNRRQPV